ncbi:MAG: tRNA modification GTPase [Haloplasmataceae bacterium]|jgi:tRNA modification GTPase|nr:tRNA modification GTPase [Haloplasmataceae bacterium]
MFNDTIVAISTALGEGAISIIRLSGNDSIEIVSKLFKGKNLIEVNSHTINYGHIINPEENSIVDEVLVSVMRAPKTFTAEDVVEINCHGGIFVTNKILEILLTHGARLAEPGEFTKRAFLNGRIDLTQAESVMDLINAKTEESLNVALNGLDGKVSQLIKNLREEVLFVVANIEVNIDYPEYDDAIKMSNEILKPKIFEVISKIEKILEYAKTGKILREGIKIAIIGRPNVGKSSLLNILMREERAIVTEIAGTTRDIIEGYINIGGIPLKIVDTAGIRETNDIIEAIGVKRSIKALEEAELVLLVLNNNEKLTESDKNLLKISESKQRIIIINKSDLETKIEKELLKNYIETTMLDDKSVDVIEKKIKDIYNLGDIKTKDQAYISNSRHIAKLKLAKRSLEDAIESIELEVPIDMVEIDVKDAWMTLGEILGEEVGDALLNELFSKFCLGK